MKLYTECAEEIPHYTSQQLGKFININRIFSLIRKKKDISRALLAKETSLTPTTVSMLVDELCERGLVREKGTGRSATGRKPILLEVNPSGAMFPVLSLCTTGFLYTLYDLGLNILEKKFRPFPIAMPDPSVTTRQFIEKSVFSETALQLLKNDAKRIDWNLVPAMCFSYLGSFHWDTGTFSCTPLRAWTMTDFIHDIFVGIGKKPIFIENGTVNIAYSEMNRLNPDADDFDFINIGEGVGVGRIENDHDNHTSQRKMLELGHVTIEIDGRKCACGNRGCVERYVNTNAIVRDIRSRIKGGESSELLNLCRGDIERISLDTIRIALDNGDEMVKNALRYVARCLSVAINNMACILQTNRIALGGGIERLGNVFLNYVREALNDTSMKSLTQKVEVTYVCSGEDSQSEGIVMQYIDDLMPDILPATMASIAIYDIDN